MIVKASTLLSQLVFCLSFQLHHSTEESLEVSFDVE
jgi:hypothetical protein